MHPGRGPGLTDRRLGERGGVEQVTVTEAQMPQHTHTVMANGFPASFQIPAANRTLARSGGGNAYQSNATSGLVDMASSMIQQNGGSQPHNNMQPFLTLTFIIALVGLYPSRS
jgi:microcystin-dependent protein